MIDLDEALNHHIHRLSEMSEEELGNAARLIERAHIHLLIEQGLRTNARAVKDLGVSSKTRGSRNP